MARITLVTTKKGEEAWVVTPETPEEKRVAGKSKLRVNVGLDKAEASILHDQLESLARASTVV